MMNGEETDEQNTEQVDESIKKHETREEMLSRHRKEIAQLQNNEVGMKKAAAKGSKAEQKAKKKQIEEEISKLTASLKQKQAEELASLVPRNTQVITKVELWKQSKGAKRRSKKALEEHEREERIKEEQSNIVSDKLVEEKKLERKLGPLGFSINEIKPDGHCLYRAVEDQLAFICGGSSPYTYTDLRQMVANYMRNNAEDFLPFMENLNDGGDSVEERFDFYCNEVEFTSAWGGQLELGALSHCLKKHITVVSGSFPDVEMGKEYQSDNEKQSRILLSYHKHAFGLGEHYNSVVPNA